MKTTLLIVAFLTSISALAATSPSSAKDYNFVFKSGKESFTVKRSAASKEVAYKLAAKDCFQKLTGGKYPGEERGLDIIDICANPKM